MRHARNSLAVAAPEWLQAHAQVAWVGRCRLRRTRYIGQERTHLGHVLTAAGLNFVRLGAWFAGTPRPRARSSPFARLMAGSAPS